MPNQPAAEVSDGALAPHISHLRELAEQSRIGEIYLRALMRHQLRLSLFVTFGLLIGFGLQPLLDWFWPAFVNTLILGIPLTWLVLGVLSYPFLVLCGYYYIRRAEAIDDEFGDLID